MRSHTGIVWFRGDLRLHDNESLTEAVLKCDSILPVFIFDERLLKKTELGFSKCGSHRIRATMQAVMHLEEQLRKLGSGLHIAYGKPEEILFDIARQVKSSWIFCNRERTYEEEWVQNELEKKMWSVGQEVLFFRGKMLIHTADLPFPVGHTPDTFTQFRKEVEQVVIIREPLPTPTSLPGLPKGFDLSGEWPKCLECLPMGFDSRTSFPFSADEQSGLARVKHYFFESHSVSKYKDTRNGLLGEDYATKFSVFLAIGSLSPKYIYSELKAYESKFGSSEHTYWVFFELLWRDFFRFQAKKYGSKIFKQFGTHGKSGKYVFKNDVDRFKIWCKGETGIPFVDANMRELNATGFMSNRGRQNVASYLVHDLKVNWLWGAVYFEHHLMDYDPCSNYGNWAYIAGVGCDPRPDRYFNVVGQGRRYDPDGHYVRHWIPELSAYSADVIHEPKDIYFQSSLSMKI